MLAGSLLLGGANAAIFLSRYAAADLGGPDARGRALGTVLFATALGTVAGPALLVPTGRLAEALGLPRLAGLYLVSVAAFARRRPGGRRPVARSVPELGRGVAGHAGREGAGQPMTRGQLAAALRPAPVRAALLVLGGTNLVMVAIMAVAPVRLLAHGHDLGFVGLAVSVHVAWRCSRPRRSPGGWPTGSAPPPWPRPAPSCCSWPASAASTTIPAATAWSPC